MILEVCWDGIRKLFFWALTISRSRALGSCVCVCGGPWKAIVMGLKSHCEVAAQVVVCFQTSSGMILEVCWDGLQTLFFWLSQFHGHSSSLVCVCVVALGKPIVTGLQSPVWSGRSRCCVFSTGGFKWWVTREVALESRSNNPWFCKGTNACREQCDHAPTFIRPTSIG